SGGSAARTRALRRHVPDRRRCRASPRRRPRTQRLQDRARKANADRHPVAGGPTMIGSPVPRMDAPLKVCGKATYTAEVWDAGQPLYGWIVGATIGHGRVTQIDTSRAEASPGVQLVWTYRNAPQQQQ